MIIIRDFVLLQCSELSVNWEDTSGETFRMRLEYLSGSRMRDYLQFPKNRTLYILHRPNARAQVMYAYETSISTEMNISYECTTVEGHWTPSALSKERIVALMVKEIIKGMPIDEKVRLLIPELWL